MKVLMITGDKRFGPGHERYELQKAAVDELVVVYWGAGATRPPFPPGPFDVVTAQDPFWRGLVALRAGRQYGARVNIQVHTDLAAEPSWRRLLARYVLSRADSIRVVSEKIKEQMGKLVPKAKVSVLPVFVDLARFTSVVREPHEGKVVLWVGRFEDEKDPLLAVEVFKKIYAQGSQVSLLMLGVGTLEPELKKAADGFPVLFPGWQDLLPYLAKADVVLCTSKFESWGASIIEALAAGVPVVAPDVGVAREAGAIVAERSQLAEATLQALTSSTVGKLHLHMPTKEEWVTRWVQTLA